MIRNTHVIVVEGCMPKVRKIVYKNLTLKMYSIGWLSAMSSLARVTLREWEKKGILPKPLFDLSDGKRLYSPAELEHFSAIIHAHYSGERNLSILRQKLHAIQAKISKEYEELAGSKQAVSRQLSNHDHLLSALQKASTSFDSIPKRQGLIKHVKV